MTGCEKHRKPMSEYDFSKHIVKVTEADNIVVHHIKLKDSMMLNVKFINTNGKLIVTGDFGNWIFGREFHPSAEGFVSVGYWNEKLGMNSVQEATEFNSEETMKEIKEGIDGGLSDMGYAGDELEIAKSYFTDLLDYADEKVDLYSAYAYTYIPSFLDHEIIPFAYTTKPRLLIVYDAFNEVCRRYEKDELSIGDYHEALEACKADARKRIGRLDYDYAKEHCEYKVGDIISDSIATIEIEEITYGWKPRHTSVPSCIYKGKRLTKNLKEYRSGESWDIYDMGHILIRKI